MLKALNLKNSTNLSDTKIRDKVTIDYQADHGFTNLFKKYPKKTFRYRNADATIFVTHFSSGAIKGYEIVKILTFDITMTKHVQKYKTFLK